MSNIFQNLIRPVRTPADFERDYAETDALNSTNALRALTMDQARGQMADATAKRNAIQQVYSSLGPSADPLTRARALQANPYTAAEGVAAEKAILENANTTAQTGERNAAADKSRFGVSEEKRKAAIMQMASLPDPQSAVEALNQAVQRGEVPMQVATLLQRTIPQAGPGFDQWKLRMIVGISEPSKMADLLKPHLQTNNVGGSTVTQAVDPITGRPTITGSIRNTQSPDNAANNATTRRGQDMTDSRSRELNSITREGQQSQVVTDPVRGTMIVNKGTGVIRPAVGPDGVAPPPEVVAKQERAAKNTLPILDEAEKLIDQATGSYVGAGIDMAGRAVGASTEGADAIAKLKVLEGNLMLAQPRMEGPQSDKDTQLYRQMAGQIGDPTVPRDMKKAALSTIREIQQRYSGSPAQTGNAFSDAEKERRYQEWKAKQK